MPPRRLATYIDFACACKHSDVVKSLWHHDQRDYRNIVHSSCPQTGQLIYIYSDSCPCTCASGPFSVAFLALMSVQMNDGIWRLDATRTVPVSYYHCEVPSVSRLVNWLNKARSSKFAARFSTLAALASVIARSMSPRKGARIFSSDRDFSLRLRS